MLSIGSFGRREYDIVFKLPLYICASTQDFGFSHISKFLLIHAHYVMSSRVRGLMFDPMLHVHPNFVNVSSKGSGESAHMCRLT